MKKAIFNLILMLVIGGIGGVLIDRFLFPYLSQVSPFNKIGWIGNQKNITQIINKTEQLIIKENEAIESAVQKAWITVGIVLQKDKKGKTLNQFSSFVLTDDGLILTSYEAVASGSNLYFLTRENKELPLEIIKKDKKLNLAILKSSNYNFSTAPLGDFEKIKLGGTVFLIGAKSEGGNFQNFVNTGIIKAINADEITLNFAEEKFASGSPLFNIKGEMIGINLVGVNGEIKVVPINKIKSFLREDKP